MELKPIETCPKDGSYFLAWGLSGYNTTPLRAEVCRYDKSFRPRNPLVNHSNDAFTEGGEPAIYWSELPFDPKAMMSDMKAHDLRSRIAELQKELETLL